MSARFILPFRILSMTSRALSNLLKLKSGVLPLYLYIKSSLLIFLSKSVIILFLSSTSSLNIYFRFEINGVSSTS